MTSFVATAGAPDSAARTVVTVVGELDIATSDTLCTVAMEALALDGCRTLALDLTDLSFIDSSGLGVLVQLRNAARSREISFALENVPPIAARVIEVAGLTNALRPSDGPEPTS